MISHADTESKLPGPPFCTQINGALCQVLPLIPQVVYLGVDGPRRETAAEARMFRLLGADVVGSNLTPEAALANELGLCFAGLVTIGNRSADQPELDPQGELRTGLEATLQVLPDFIRVLDTLPACSCAGEIVSVTRCNPPHPGPSPQGREPLRTESSLSAGPTSVPSLFRGGLGWGGCISYDLT